MKGESGQMQFILKAIITVIMTICMNTGISSLVSTTPEQAADDFLSQMRAGESAVMEKHMDNQYVNFLCNIEGDKAVVGRMNEALFKNFSYKIEDIGEKNDVAVAKVVIECNDFSQVMAGYDKASYNYIGENLYSDEIADKEKLNAKCLDIYVQQIEAAAGGASAEKVIYLSMVDNGYYGWNIIVTDDLMKSILGGLEMPATK